jgi:hypothetical protein
VKLDDVLLVPSKEYELLADCDDDDEFVGEPEHEVDLEDDTSSVEDCVGVADGPERD